MSKGALHENLSHDDQVAVGPDRSFGFVFTVVFVLLGVATYRASEESLFTWLAQKLGTGNGTLAAVFLGFAGVFLLLALVAPTVLHPLNVLWMRLAGVLQKIVSPVVLGILFFGVLTPMGLLVRARGADLLRLKLDRAAKTYWINRDPPGPKPETMTEQF